MSPRTLVRATIREAPVLPAEQAVGDAVRSIIEARLPALPVVRADGGLLGVFGEREFIGAMFPGYLGQLRSAAFVPESVDEVIEQRLECREWPVSRYTNVEHIEAGPGVSDVQLAETFLHHHVLIVPVVDGNRVTGIVTRSDFFTALVERLSERG